MLANGIRETSATTGTGALTLALVTGFTRFSNGFAVSSQASYAINNGNNWEWGIGTVGAGNTLARTTITATLVAGVYTTTGATAISLTGVAVVMCVEHTGTVSNLTGAITSVGNATSLGSFTSAQLAGALTNETGTGSAVFATSPTFAVDITTPKANVFKSGFGVDVGKDNVLGTTPVGAVENIILGLANSASLGNAFAIGTANTVTGDLNSGGFSFGYGNTVNNSYGNGDFSNTVGFNNFLSVGGNSNAFGNNNVTSASGASVFGNDITNSIANSVMIGASDSSKVTILSTGNVGIGTASPVGKFDVNGTIRTAGYTVATLPAGTIGMRAYVTDALAPTFLATVIGGGTIKEPVFYNGTNWVSA